MTMHSVNVREKGQITLPAEIRRELGVSKGDTLLIERRGKAIMLVLPDDIVDPTAGALEEYAYTRNPDPSEERRWIAQHIAETADEDE